MIKSAITQKATISLSIMVERTFFIVPTPVLHQRDVDPGVKLVTSIVKFDLSNSEQFPDIQLATPSIVDETSAKENGEKKKLIANTKNKRNLPFMKHQDKI